MRILIAAGGTGGHVYPALAAAEALMRANPQISLCFVGSGGLERGLVRESGIPFAAYDEVRAGPVAGVSWARKLLSAVDYAIGFVQASALLRRWRPQALLLTGGWSGLPVAMAAWLGRVPVLIFLPDIEPGATIRTLRRLARQVALTVPESDSYFPRTPTIVTGYPLRAAFQQATREAAIAHFGLDEERKTLLVFGGSRGARSINRALLDILPDLLADGVQVLHVSGTLDWPEVEARRDALGSPDHYHAYAYLHEMPLAFAAADLAVSRAGASTLAEFPYFGLASILVPYPHAWRYQKVNADYLAERGAALRMDDERLAEDLLPAIRAFLQDEARLATMRACARALARPDGADRLAAALIHLAGGNHS
ncbi:MAG: UDP-N-acetylglucosamine--N-acetylmuramyl-(pentapeptide) pyrophosphoryl-undecaprenol N-acetylglucosamine transferase [Anaerolineae bacterium]|nr:UDP-N-acetylglucosamine--N-acetylmuramyl-(pentapeptide) pyrophosphoryl-undecaprenol N-acetylglucosamine transferase [Anaerolineae bacterium]